MAVINSVIAIYKAVESFVEYFERMLGIVNSFVEGILEIAEGNIKKAADFLERSMAAAVPVVIGFLANQVNLGKIGKKIVEIIEKPQNPPSDYAVTGLYFYDNDVFEICRTLKPSARGELEITDVNNAYMARGDLTHDILDGWWTDAGTFESLYRATQLVAEGGANLGGEGAKSETLFAGKH